MRLRIKYNLKSCVLSMFLINLEMFFAFNDNNYTTVQNIYVNMYSQDGLLVAYSKALKTLSYVSFSVFVFYLHLASHVHSD